jgi:hypothetical protein
LFELGDHNLAAHPHHRKAVIELPNILVDPRTDRIQLIAIRDRIVVEEVIVVAMPPSRTKGRLQRTGH